MVKVNKGAKAIQIFYDYDKQENRLPTKAEFDQAYYGRVLKRGESNYYYEVKRKYVKEKELEGDSNGTLQGLN